MAGTRRITHQVEDEGEGDDAEVIEETAEDLTPVREQEADEIATVLEELGAQVNESETKVRIYRRGEGAGGSRAYIIERPVSKLGGILDELRRIAGPGKYQGYVYARKKLKKVLNWEIGELLNPETASAATPEGAVAAMFAQHSAILRDLVGQIATLKQAPPAPVPAAAGLADTLALVREVMAMIPRPAPAPAAGIDGQMNLLTGVIGLAKELANEGKEKSWIDALSDFAPMLQDMMRQRTAPAAVPGAPQPPALTPGAPGPAPIASPAPREQVNPAPAAAPIDHGFDENMLQQQIAFLLTGAQANTDPQSYADVIQTLVPAPMLSALMSLDDPVLELVRRNPNVEPYRAWFEDLVDCLTADDSSDDNGGDATQRAPAAFNHAQHSGGPRRGGGDTAPNEATGERTEG